MQATRELSFLFAVGIILIPLNSANWLFIRSQMLANLSLSLSPVLMDIFQVNLG